MKAYLEKVKSWLQKNPQLAAGIGGLLIVGVYYLFFSKKEAPAATEVQANPTQGGFIVQQGESGQSSAGGSASDANAGILSGMTTLFKGFGDSIADLGESFNSALTAERKTTETAIKGVSDSVQRVSALVEKLSTPSAMQPNYPQYSYPVQQPPAAATVWQAKVTDVVGGTGGGMVYASDPNQLQRMYEGKEPSSKSSWSADYKDWKPAGAKNVGNIEQQTAGMSQSEKLSWAKSKGLIN